jgi:triacylglycerol lipase
MRNSATVYYGNQEALGTIEYNARDIQKKIIQVLKETGAEKVNIIAHSKGGLDARYAISKLDLHNYVASLTTISTPHWGCKFVDKACSLPEGLYRFIAKRFDNTFRRLGDKNPDFYTATRQFATFNSKHFNETVIDSDDVFYQSYMTKMKSGFSDPLLLIPHRIIKAVEGENDGLVSIDSAKWGEFKGVISNGYRRGISHGDIIDLKREDYKDFDVLEFYVDLVSGLKAKGF